jgi:two-component system osmolarity sensor histidine kinase EnvZ|tara:strand:- start:118 stop:1629 length:1512 start_codon:yes stop_codon:yes gene_type:complete
MYSKISKFQFSLRQQWVFSFILLISLVTLCVDSYYRYTLSRLNHFQSIRLSAESFYNHLENKETTNTNLEQPDIFEKFTFFQTQPNIIVTSTNIKKISFPISSKFEQETSFSITQLSGQPTLLGNQVLIKLYSNQRYQNLSKIKFLKNSTVTQKFGIFISQLAKSCGQRTLVVGLANGKWFQIDAKNVWSCKSLPKDNRYLYTIFVGLILFYIFHLGYFQISRLEGLTENLKNLATHGGSELIETKGPKEIKNLTLEINRFLENERTRLEERAGILSAVSHDLGTVATRLNLRSQVHLNSDSNTLFSKDIKYMTEMVDGILSYTRNEMENEPRSRVSLRSHVEAIVLDYQDLSKAVSFFEPQPLEWQTTNVSIIPRTRGKLRLDKSEKRQFFILIQPNSIRRAIENLIENALKYGGRAEVSLNINKKTVNIVVKSPSTNAKEDIEKLITPFVRGRNSGKFQGVGLGLSIVENIAKKHGGTLKLVKLENIFSATINLPTKPENL